MIGWQEAKATMLDEEADTIEGVLLWLRKLEGMFEVRATREIVASALDTLSIECLNRRTAADRLRKEGDVDHVAARRSRTAGAA